MKILVADDDATLRSGLRELLEEDGHQVVAASDGGEAMRLIDREAFDVALLDLHMPKASGLEVLHRLRASQPGAAAVMITGQGTIDAAVEAMKAGAVDFVEKPYEVETLRRTLRAVEEERSARKTMSGSSSGVAAGPILSEAAARGALLAVLGPAGTPPSGAARVLRIDAKSRPPGVFAPRQLYALNVAIEEHLKEAERPVVYAADLAMLETTHGRADVLAWIRHVSGKCSAKGGTLVLGRVDPALAAEVAADLTADVPSGPLQGMLESLANPIRRAVVGYVFASGPVAYSAILKKSFVDSSSKLSFHLSKLQTDGLLAKGDAGRYAVTDAGQRAWRVVRAFSERRAPAIVLSEP